jgi:hypothetical protein
MFILTRYQTAVEALSALLPWPGKNILLTSFANAWLGFSAKCHKIVDVFLFVFNFEKIVSAQVSDIPYNIYCVFTHLPQSPFTGHFF